MTLKKCNMCGKSFDMWDDYANFGMSYEIGYGSKHDGESLDLDLCCDCFDRVMDIITPMCKLPPWRESASENDEYIHTKEKEERSTSLLC